MRKLDAKLIAYLAGEDMPAKLESEEVSQLTLESLQDSVDEMVKERIREQQLQLFKSMCSIRLQLEALTLEPEGTKRMELLQSEIRPIFTVECQLSHELIKNMPRYDMFHIMQFESEKFHSLTQCTRFGQEDERNVKLCLDELDQQQPNFGRIHFTVWWREPGTCLNEMLGMGVLQLEELYNASLLEQCKRITIKRRGILLANLYLKISLQLQPDNNNTVVQADVQQLSELLEQGADYNGNNGEGESTKQQPQQVEQQNMNTQPADTVAAAATTAAATDAAEANAAALPSNNNTNSNFQLESSSFAAETTKVRLLKGFIYASETRNLEMNSNREYVLVCRRFWQEQAAALIAGEGGNFNYQEQFGVINDEQFLSRVDRQHLQLEVWQRGRLEANVAADGNGNQPTNDLEPIGVVQLPLHQFYIAYRDEAMANRLCKGKLPVISIDAWVPIVNQQQQNNTHCGELKCLLAIGSEEQIINLKSTRGFTPNTEATPSTNIDNALFAHNRLAAAANSSSTQPAGKATNPTNTNTELKKRTELLDMLQKALQSPPTATTLATAAPQTANAATPLKPLQPKMFKFELEIVGANGLPLNPAAKGKKNAKRNANAAASKRFPPNEAPSTYVTFQADECHGSKLHKSHEGGVYATGIVEKCTRPQWQQLFRVSSSVDYLKNPQQRFILKIWKKAATNAAQPRAQPTPLDDGIIGFAALDLTVFLRGLQIAGWFNIVDFNGRINGQLELRAKPLENVHKILQHAPPPTETVVGSVDEAPNVDAVIDQFESSLDLTHLNLGQAIKRKFTELEEISQRLRTRLADVTGEQLASQFDINTLDGWQPLDGAAAAADDADLDEFEHYINTAPSTSSAPSALATDEANKNEIMISTKQESADRPDE